MTYRRVELTTLFVTIIDNGEWVAKYPERTKDGGGIRGYSISQMNAVWITADDLKRKELATPSKQAFYNYMLG